MKPRTLKVVCAALTAAVAGGGYGAWASVHTPTQKVVTQTVTASSGDVTEHITASGVVQAAQTFDLSFSGTGRVVALDAAVSKAVKAGDVLGRLDPSNAQTQLDTAKSNVASAQSKLDQTIAGLSKAERAQLQISVAQSEAQVASAGRSMEDSVANAAQNERSYQATVDAAQAALDNAQTTADLNAKTYQSSIDSAQSALDNAHANADLNAKTYQSSIDSAQLALDNARRNAELNVKNYNTAVDQAQTGLDNAKSNADLNATSITASVGQAASALANETNTLFQYQAELAAAQAALAAGKGTQAAVDAAQSKLNGQQRSVVSAQNSYASATNNAASSSAKDSQSVKSAEQTTLTNALNNQAAGLEKDGQSIKSAQTQLTSAQNSQTIGIAKDAQSVKSAEAQVATVQNSQTIGVAKDAQSIKSAQAQLVSAQNTVDSGHLKDSQAMSNAKTSVASAQLGLRSTKAGNAVKLAPPKAGDVASLRAQVSSALAAVTSAQKSIDDLVLKSPIDGIVTVVNGRIGQTSPQGSFVEVLSTDLDVKVGFSEANAAKLSVGQRASVTFDAVPNVTVTAVVSEVDPSATSVQNVATYNALMRIPGAQSKGVKPGMTAQADVVVNEKKGVVILPSSAITTARGRTIVTIRKGTVDTPTQVQSGLVGSQGTEIVSGVSAGDVIVIPQVSNLASLITGARAGGGQSGPPGAAGR